MTTIRLINLEDFNHGDMLQVTDRERKSYTLKFEGSIGPNVIFKQMGRNTTKIFQVEANLAQDYIHTQYRKVERVLKFQRPF